MARFEHREEELWEERRSVAARRRFLPPGPLREAAERRLWAIGHAIADLYPRRPAPAAASWACDSEAS